MPKEMKGPWRNNLAELRITDMPARNQEEFEAYLHKYSEKGEMKEQDWRFIEPSVFASNKVRISHRTQADIFRYILNYIQRNDRYDEAWRNCQTFAADFYGFLAGKKD